MMTEANAEQIEYWNGENACKWIRNQQRLDQALAPFSAQALNAAAVGAGEVVLDVGCGAGATTLALAERGARVIGVDVSAPLLAHARGRPGAEGVAFVEADASRHDFGAGVFDLIFSRFGIMFFSRAESAFAHLGRMSRPGGRLAFVCWRPMSQNPWMLKPTLIAKDFVELPPRPGPEEPGPFSFDDPARITRILEAGGYGEIAIEAVDHMMDMGATVKDAVVSAMEVGPMAGVVAGIGTEALAELRAALSEMLSGHAEADAVRLPAAVWIVTATRP